MDLQFSGLVSGMDWKGFVEQMMKVSQAPKNLLTSRKTTAQTIVSTIGNIGTRMDGLQTAAKALKETSAFQVKTTSVENTTNPAIGSVSAGEHTPIGKYEIEIVKMASNSFRASSANTSKPINDSADVSSLTLSTMNLGRSITSGTFTVNGGTVDILTSDSLQSVFDKISVASGGVVTASYDHENDVIKLASVNPIRMGSSADTSNFLQATKLFANETGAVESSSKLGAINISTSLSNAGFSTDITDGSFSINGVSFSYTGTQSIQSLMNSVNNSSAGVSLSYDSNNDKFIMTNKTTGSLDVNISQTSGNILSAMKLDTSTLTQGADAQFKINNGSVLTSHSNVLNENDIGIPGLSFSILKTGTENVSVGSDTSALKTKIKTFVDAYNSVQSYLSDQTKITSDDSGNVTKSTLSSNREINIIQMQLRNIAFGSNDSLSIKRLQDIGIDFKADGSNLLEIKSETTLQNSLDNNLESVSNLFSDGSSGLGQKFDDFVSHVKDNSLKTMTDSYNSQISSIDKQIGFIDLRLAAEEERLTKSFIAMEKMQAQMQAQMSALSNFIAQLNA